VLQAVLARLLSAIDDYGCYVAGWDGEQSEPYKLQFLLYAKDVVRALTASLSWRSLCPSVLTICPEDDSCISLFCGYGDRSIEVFIFGDDIDLTVFMSAPGEEDRCFHFTPHLFSGSVFEREMDWLECKNG